MHIAFKYILHTNCMRKAVDTSVVNVNARLPVGLVADIDKELKEYNRQNNRTEFIRVSITFYLQYLAEQRIKEAESKSVYNSKVD